MAPQALSEQTLIARAPDAIEGPLPAETVLLRIDDGSAVRVNPTAAWLWAQLAEPLTLARLAERLAERHGLDPERGLADARSFAEDLGARGFLVLGEGPPPTSDSVS